ncbi:MAG: hypothetical protein MUO26_07620 [Methanotrichaceae archaeon]|nr:hypothetical protein [Methanotrichaceae archaeon]
MHIPIKRTLGYSDQISIIQAVPFLPLNILRISNQRILAIPAAKQMARSLEWSNEKLNRSLKGEMYSTANNSATAPPNIHHSAGLGVLRVWKIVLDQDRFMRIKPKLEKINVVNVKVPCFRCA